MKFTNYLPGVAALAIAASFASPAAAQDQGQPGVTAEGPEETVFDGDYLSVGVGVGYGASYTGSDDYRAFVLPVVQGSYRGIDIDPRAGGVALTFLKAETDGGPNFAFGIAGRINTDRTDIDDIDDAIVEAYGELDTAIEVGPTASISFPGLLNPYDSLSANVDVVWDVAGAHDGMLIAPSIAYFTPLSRGIAVSLSASATYIDDDYADYYYSVAPNNPALPIGSRLPGFQAEGGFESVGTNLLVAYDLGGNLADGGVSLIGIGGYSHLLGDAEDTPFTAIRGDADQWFAAIGIGYTF
jgi:outer membrane scaffolding protein for murein synthesis (MipA/OmpV family)